MLRRVQGILGGTGIKKKGKSDGLKAVVDWVNWVKLGIDVNLGSFGIQHTHRFGSGNAIGRSVRRLGLAPRAAAYWRFWQRHYIGLGVSLNSGPESGPKVYRGSFSKWARETWVMDFRGKKLRMAGVRNGMSDSETERTL